MLSFLTINILIKHCKNTKKATKYCIFVSVMNKYLLNIISNSCVAKDVFRMELTGEIPALKCGSFVEIAVEGCYLRRPISVCASCEGHLTLVYKIVGEGTRKMSELSYGQKVDLIGGLGNGFSLSPLPAHPLLIGGGIGTAPLLQLATDLRAAGSTPLLLAGFNSASDIFLEKEFTDLCAQVIFTTLDGSRGIQGMVTEVLSSLHFDYFYACGPMPMLKAVSTAIPHPGQLSLEERMGCGFGICMGCSIQTAGGPKRICKEGPVFRKEELLW